MDIWEVVVNQATMQRRWLVMVSWYDSQGHIVRCGCVSASEEGMKYSDWIWYPRSSMMSSQSYKTYSEQWREWGEEQREDVSHLWSKRCREPFGGLRLDVWLCASESPFAVCSSDDIHEVSTKPETLCFNPFTSKTYYVRAWNHQPMPNQFEPDWSLYLAVTSHYST